METKNINKKIDVSQNEMINRMKKIAKYCISIIGIILLIIVLLGYTNLGNLSVNENQENHFLEIGKEKIRYSK